MAKVRIGFGTEFSIGSELSGIGTDNSTNTKQVLGNIHATDLKAVGVSTLATYQGFLNKEAKLSNNIDINSQAGTLGEIIIEGDVTVSSGSTICSSVDELTLTNSFSLPTGDTDSRIHCKTAGSMRFNEDFGTLEFYTGDEWRVVNSFVDTGNRGRALNVGGQLRNSPYYQQDISYINVQSRGNAVNFGDQTGAYADTASLANELRGIIAMGNASSGVKNDIQYVTMASEGDAIDFGDLTTTRFRGAAASNSTRGIVIGGRTPSTTNVIDYMQIMTLGNALDFGDLGTADTRGCGTGSSPTRAVMANKFIDFVTIASTGNSVEFGKDLFAGNYHPGGGSTGTRAMWAGGYCGPAYSPYTAIVKTTSIRGINIESGGVAVEYGNLATARGSTGASHTYFTGTSDKTRAVWMGGYQQDPNQHVNNIDYFQMNSTGNALDFGDLMKEIALNSSCCDSHGGLGGI